MKIRIPPSEWCAPVHEAIEKGFVVRVERDRVTIFDHTKHACTDFGFNVEVVIKHAARLNWPDIDLIGCLRKGFDYACDDTPPISTFSPHYSQAMENAREFFLQVTKEIQRGWFSDAQKVPLFIPFGVLPGSIIEKLDRGFRLVWDASWPHPSSPFGSIQTKDGRFIPIDANIHTEIPDDFKSEWPSIEAIGETLSTLQTVANMAELKVYARTYDLSKWFRQLAAAPSEWWKALIFGEEGYRYDMRVQMGRTIAAHHGHRLSQLIAAII